MSQAAASPIPEEGSLKIAPSTKDSGWRTRNSNNRVTPSTEDKRTSEAVDFPGSFNSRRQSEGPDEYSGRAGARYVPPGTARLHPAPHACISSAMTVIEPRERSKEYALNVTRKKNKF